MDNYELYHHGVKGQKWGVIRTAAQLGHHPAVKKAGSVAKKSAQKFGKFADKQAAKAKKAAVAKIKQSYKEHKEKKYYEKLHKKKLSQMTDKEIKDLTKRVQQETILKDAKYEMRTKNARKFYDEYAKQPVNSFATTFGTQLAKKIVEDMGKESTTVSSTESAVSKAKTAVDAIRQNRQNRQSKRNDIDVSVEVVNDTPKKTAKAQPSYLERSLANQRQAEGRMRAESWTNNFNSTRNTLASDRYFDTLSRETTGRSTAKRPTANYGENNKVTPSSNSNKVFDDYFESEVRKEERRRRR